MKKIIILMFVILCIVSTGCSKNNKKNSDNYNKLSEEEQIWNDAKSEETYKYLANLPLNSFNEQEKDSYYTNLLDMKETNKFANKIYNLSKSNDINQVFESENEFKKQLICAYATSYTTYGECTNYSWRHVDFTSSENYKNLSNYKLKNVLEFGFNDNGTIDNKYSRGMLLNFVNESNNDELCIEYTYYYYNDSTLPFISASRIEKTCPDKSFGFGEYKYEPVDNDLIDSTINSSKEFLDFYLKYKQEIYYPKFLSDSNNYVNTDNNEPKIGMTAAEVKNSSWGSPDKINKDTYSWGTTEQWVYNKKGYIYFKNGKVTSISER